MGFGDVGLPNVPNPPNEDLMLCPPPPQVAISLGDTSWLAAEQQLCSYRQMEEKHQQQDPWQGRAGCGKMAHREERGQIVGKCVRKNVGRY